MPDRNGVKTAHTRGVGWCTGPGTYPAGVQQGMVHLLGTGRRCTAGTVRGAILHLRYTGPALPALLLFSQDLQEGLFSSSLLLFFSQDRQEGQEGLFSSSFDSA